MREVIETTPGIYSVFSGCARIPEAQFNSTVDATVYATGRDVLDDPRSSDALNRLKMAILGVEMTRKRFGVEVKRLRDVGDENRMTA